MIRCFLGVHILIVIVIILLYYILCWFILSDGDVLIKPSNHNQWRVFGHFRRVMTFMPPTGIQIVNSQHRLQCSPAMLWVWSLKIRILRMVWGSGSFQRCTHGFTHCTTEPWLRKSCSSVGVSAWGTNVSGEFGDEFWGTFDERCSQPSCDLLWGHYLPFDPRFP